MLLMLALVGAGATQASAKTWKSTWASSSSPIKVGYNYGIKGSAWGTWTLNSDGWLGEGLYYLTTWTAGDFYDGTPLEAQMYTWSSSGSCTTGTSGGVTLPGGVGASGGRTASCTYDWGSKKKTVIKKMTKQITQTKYSDKRGANPSGNGIKASFKMCIIRPWYDVRSDICSAEPQSAAYTLPVTQL